jgi:predicted ATPase
MSPRALPSGTVTFLFTDVEGSTRLLHELGDAYADVIADHRRVLREAFARHGGVEVDTQGDAFFVVFGRASDALAAARDATEALDGPIRVRIGLHTGEPLVTDEGYVGIDVHRAARIAAVGHGGQILVSRSTRDLVGADGLRDLGEHRLKDLTAPERIFQLGDADFPPLKTLYQTNLPIPATPFLGRDGELSDIAALLQREDVRLLSLTGAGGSGKTRLALQAVGAAADRYPDGAWWVPLAAVTDPGAVLEAATRALGATGELAPTVGSRRMVLLLDNFEHVISAATDLPTLLAECPNLDVVVTSRERLQVAGEHVYSVPVLARPESRDLFTARARAVRPDFEPDDLVDDLCERLDDLPLALELAAARTTVLSTSQLLDRLGARLDLLRGGRDAEVRQQTLRATIEWSYELLDAVDQRLFSRLGVFVGGCTLDAAERICEADLDSLQSLVDKSLVRLREGERFWMLETIREYAVERLEASGESDIRRRHAEFFNARADSASRPSVDDYFNPVLQDQANFRAAIDWSLQNDVALGLQIAVGLEQFWVTHAPSEGVRRLEVLLDHAADVDPVLRARALRVLGSASVYAGDDERAERAFRQGLELFVEAEDEEGATVMRFRIGTTRSRSGDFANGEMLLEESLQGFRRLGNRTGEGEALGNLGTLEFKRGNVSLGRELIEQSIAIAREVGFEWWEAGKLLELGQYALAAGEVDEGDRRARDALRIYSGQRGRQNIVAALAVLAWAAAAHGDAHRAGTLWGAIEADEARGPLGFWEQRRDEYAARLTPAFGPEFDRACEAGRGLSLEDAVEYALA